MPPWGESGPTGSSFASLRRRFAAWAIDAGIVVISLGVAGVVTFRWLTGTAERRAPDEREDEPGLPRVADWFRRWGPTLTVFSFVTEVLGRNGRGPGAHLLGLRRVDARTGGPVTVRSALIGSSVRVVTTPLQVAAVTAVQNRRQERTRTAEPGPQFSTSAGCLAPLTVTVAPHLPALLAPGHRSLSDRAAGIVVVVERRS